MERFLEELTSNEDLRAIFLAQTSIDGAYMVAEPYLDGMSKEEFSEEMTGLARNIMDSGALTDEQLAMAAGGVGGGPMLNCKEMPSWMTVGLFVANKSSD